MYHREKPGTKPFTPMPADHQSAGLTSETPPGALIPKPGSVPGSMVTLCQSSFILSQQASSLLLLCTKHVRLCEMTKAHVSWSLTNHMKMTAIDTHTRMHIQHLNHINKVGDSKDQGMDSANCWDISPASFLCTFRIGSAHENYFIQS